MKITDALLGEHGTLYSLFDEVDRFARVATNLGELKAAARMVGVALISHSKIEEEYLFPAIEKAIGPHGPLSVMLAEHQEIDLSFGSIESAQSLSQARAALEAVLEVTRGHFMKEEAILFGIATQELGDGTLTALGDKWAAVRRVRLDGAPCH